MLNINQAAMLWHAVPESNSTFSVLRHRGFRLFWVGNLVSGCGIWMQNMALGWLIAKLYNSSLLLGFYGFASLVPTLCFALFGGTLADRFDRRRILIVTQTVLMLLALGLAALTHWGLLLPWHIMITAALTGVAVAMTSPAYQAILADLVPAEDLTRAIALNSVQFNVARIIGHSLAGFAIATLGAAGCFLLNAVSYVVMLVALGVLRVESRHRRADAVPFVQRAREGIDYIRGHHALLQLIVVVGCISLLGLPYFFLLPGFGRDVLHVGAVGLGCMTAAVSVGGLFGGLSMTRITRRWEKRAVIAGASLLFWACLLMFALSRNYWLSVMLLVAVGFALVLAIAIVNNLLQASTPPEMRGRVMSIHGLAVNGLAPVGSLIAGVIAQSTSSTPLAVASMAALGGVITAAVLAISRRKRSEPDEQKEHSSNESKLTFDRDGRLSEPDGGQHVKCPGYGG